MADKKRLVVPVTVVTLTTLLGACIGQLAPEPSDSIFFWFMDWLRTYGSVLDPMFARFAELWTFYILGTTWYLFLIALVLQFGKRKEIITSLIKLLTLFVLIYMAAYWLGGLPPLPMSFELGMQMLIGSILLFTALTTFIIWKLGQLRTEITFK